MTGGCIASERSQGESIRLMGCSLDLRGTQGWTCLFAGLEVADGSSFGTRTLTPLREVVWPCNTRVFSVRAARRFAATGEARRSKALVQEVHERGAVCSVHSS